MGRLEVVERSVIADSRDNSSINSSNNSSNEASADANALSAINPTTTASPRRLSFPVMVAFGIGQTAEGIKNTAFNTFLLFFYQQVLGVPGTYIGIALGIALIFDAITDPVAGSLSDKVRTRWGRRHPFILCSAFPLGIAFYALFNPPAELSALTSAAWLCVFAILVRGSLTFYHVPHLALGAEMAHDYNQRSSVFAFSILFSALGGAMLGFFAYRIFFPTTPEFTPGLLNPAGYHGFSLLAGIAAVASILLCLAGTWKEIPHLKVPPPSPPFSPRRVVSELGDLFANPSFRTLFVGMLFATTSLAVEAVFTPYMGLHFWGLTTEQLSLVPVVLVAGLLLSVPLTPLVTRWLDKKRVVVLMVFITVINMNAIIVLRLLDVSWFPDNDSPWILRLMLLRWFITGISGPIIYSSINSMFADIADEHELEIGERREGIIYSARSFTQKATGAIGVIVGGAIIDLIAFPSGAKAGTVDADTLWWLGFAEGPGTSVFTLIGVVLYLRYRIDRYRHAEIMEALAMRSQQH
jgi:GPH family glycoside/pentoside/hexuronide:cation symporter